MTLAVAQPLPLEGLTAQEQRQQILLALRQIVEEVGADHTYTQHLYSDHPRFPRPLSATGERFCAYLHPVTNKPDCIIGRLLVKLGVPISGLHAYENQAAGITISRFTGIRDEDLLRSMSYLQLGSDLGQPWGNVLSRWAQQANVPV